MLLSLLTFAIPVRVWRTGQLPSPLLPVVVRGPDVEMPRRVWIDTDAACGHARRTDPDDCFGLLLLAKAPGIDIAGISTVFGNAPIDVADATTRDVVAALSAEGLHVPTVYRGSATALPDTGLATPATAHTALRRALEEGPLTVIALGPLTNIAAALAGRPDLQKRVGRLVAVMGRRPGHVFHPAEGIGGGMLFGHGPVFRDFNFDMDRTAATLVLAMQVPTTLIPYDVARHVSVTGADLAALEAYGGSAAWIATRARPWLDFWEKQIGRPGFFPFDLLAGAYVLDHRQFDCAPAQAWVSKDDQLKNIWIFDPMAMLVGLPEHVPTGAVAHAAVVYCTNIDPRLHGRLMAALVGGPDFHESKYRIP